MCVHAIERFWKKEFPIHSIVKRQKVCSTLSEDGKARLVVDSARHIVLIGLTKPILQLERGILAVESFRCADLGRNEYPHTIVYTLRVVVYFTINCVGQGHEDNLSHAFAQMLGSNTFLTAALL